MIPINAYFEDAYLAQEMRALFAPAPQYFGHESMIPFDGDYATLDWMDHSKSLRNVGGAMKLIGNICRHRQAIIHQGRGNGSHFTCNLHGWTYDKGGALIGAPHFPQTPCLKLSQQDLVNWNGMLFDKDVSATLGQSKFLGEVDFTQFQYHNHLHTDYNFNWKTFIEVYSEDYHVDPFHPGLGKFVDCSSLEWELGDGYHVQRVGAKMLNRSTPVYERWTQNASAAAPCQYGAVWAVLYPNIMIEIYPNTLVMSIVIPRGAEGCRVLTEFYYHPDALFEEGFIEAQQAAYMETAVEDDEICYRMNRGRKALYEQKQMDAGPYQNPTEVGLEHFHAYYMRAFRDTASRGGAVAD